MKKDTLYFKVKQLIQGIAAFYKRYIIPRKFLANPHLNKVCNEKTICILKISFERLKLTILYEALFILPCPLRKSIYESIGNYISNQACTKQELTDCLHHSFTLGTPLRSFRGAVHTGLSPDLLYSGTWKKMRI